MSEELRRGIPKFEVIGTRTFTEEEKVENRRKTIECLLRLGIIKPGEEHKVKDMDVDQMKRYYLSALVNSSADFYFSN